MGKTKPKLVRHSPVKHSSIIHISGFPGSGKSTLGELIAKTYPHIAVKDTDEFIQHGTSESKELVQITFDIAQGKDTWAHYQRIWKRILTLQMQSFVDKHPNQTIVFIGSLDNFGPPDVIFNPKADMKWVLDVPLPELMRRYYTRICSQHHNVEYWQNLSLSQDSTMSSTDIIREQAKYNAWHNQHGYIFLSDKQILSRLNEFVPRKPTRKTKK